MSSRKELANAIRALSMDAVQIAGVVAVQASDARTAVRRLESVEKSPRRRG